ncbi:hypothetical protein AAMO2058_001016900 [Amorphochlora amoebiformis]
MDASRPAKSLLAPLLLASCAIAASPLRALSRTSNTHRSVASRHVYGGIRRLRSQPERIGHSRNCVRVRAAKTMTILVPPHPLIKHYLGIARLEVMPPLMTKNALVELGRILMYELVRDWLPVVEQEIEATYATAEASFIDSSKPIQIVPIGTVAPVLLEQTGSLLPASQSYHCGLKTTGEDSAEYYLNTLPEKILEGEKVLLVIPELASHQITDRVLTDVIERGGKPENIRIMSVLVAPPALTKLGLKYPDVRVYTAMIDPEVDDSGKILPGLGDLSFRVFVG